MAVLELNSDQLAETYRKTPFDKDAKVRYAYFSKEALTAQADVGSTIELADLPPGRIQLLPHLSRLKNSAFGVGALLSIGHAAYEKADGVNGEDTTEPEDDDAFADAIDVAGAGDSVAFSDALKFDMYSKAGVRVFATVEGAAMPVGASLSGLIAYRMVG